MASRFIWVPPGKRIKSVKLPGGRGKIHGKPHDGRGVPQRRRGRITFELPEGEEEFEIGMMPGFEVEIEDDID